MYPLVRRELISVMDDKAVLLEGENEADATEKPLKSRKPGIVYLSTIPPNMNVTKMRDYFGKFGEIDRVYLQASDNSKGQKAKVKKHKKSLHFTEGWIEFKSKRRAKQAHLFLNNQPVGGKKRNPYYDMLWNVRYLPRFKWAYLKQRLEYEREVHRQRMSAEISQVRRETDHFIKASEISEKKKKKEEKKKKKEEKKKENVDSMQNKDVEDQNISAKGSGKMFIFKQKETENALENKKEERMKKNELFRNKIAEKRKKRQEMRKKRNEITRKPEEDFLSSVFVGSTK